MRPCNDGDTETPHFMGSGQLVSPRGSEYVNGQHISGIGLAKARGKWSRQKLR